MTISDVFAKLGKLLATYDNLTAVSIRVEGGTCNVRGVGAQRAFGFIVKLDEAVDDFSFVTTPSNLNAAFGLYVCRVNMLGDKLVVEGTVDKAGDGNDDAGLFKITCDPAGAAIIQQAEVLSGRVTNLVAETKPESALCILADVLPQWRSLAKCGKTLYLTPDLTYATSASVAAYFSGKGTYSGLEIDEDGEPLQVDSSYPAELSAVCGVCGTQDFYMQVVADGKILIAVSEDKDAFALSCAAISSKNTVQRAVKRYQDACGFPTISLPQSAVRDILAASADKLIASIESTAEALEFNSGFSGKILTDADSLSCVCNVTREHAAQALGALPAADDLSFGYGQSNGRMFVSFGCSDLLFLIPAQDTTEI